MGYVPADEEDLHTLKRPNLWLRVKLRDAQDEIERLQRQYSEREVHEILRRIDALGKRLPTPPKDLTDSYPKDGPNVREYERYLKLSEWMEGLDKRVGLAEKSGDRQLGQLETRLTALSETVARNKRAAAKLGPRWDRRVKQRRITGLPADMYSVLCRQGHERRQP